MRANPIAQWTPELLSDGTWGFKSDIGTYLARCDNCLTGGKHVQMAFPVFQNTSLSTAHWKVFPAISLADQFLEKFPGGAVNLQADSGKFLAVCEKCGPTKPAYPYDYSAGVYEDNPKNSVAIWEAIKVGASKIALKGDNGRFISRCAECWQQSIFPDAAFV